MLRVTGISQLILPFCPFAKAIGARLAYEAAVGNLQDDIMNLFVASNFRKDPAWYALNEGLDGETQVRMETEAAKGLLPHIDMLLEMLEVEPYIVAPIVSDEKWNCYVNRLDTYGEMPTPTRFVICELLLIVTSLFMRYFQQQIVTVLRRIRCYL